MLTDTGVLSLTQALGVMLGANVGTTVTAQLIALPLERTALPLCAVGLAVRYLGQRKSAGTALFGLGAVFFGLSFSTWAPGSAAQGSCNAQCDYNPHGHSPGGSVVRDGVDHFGPIQ